MERILAPLLPKLPSNGICHTGYRSAALLCSARAVDLYRSFLTPALLRTYLALARHGSFSITNRVLATLLPLLLVNLLLLAIRRCGRHSLRLAAAKQEHSDRTCVLLVVAWVCNRKLCDHFDFEFKKCYKRLARLNFEIPRNGRQLRTSAVHVLPDSSIPKLLQGRTTTTASHF
jgi:hypothetical protein